MVAAGNIRKSKSITATLAVMFLVAAMLLNVGLLVSLNYGGFFAQLRTELNTSNALFMIPDDLMTDEVIPHFEQSAFVQALHHEESLVLSTKILSEGKQRNFAIMFMNMDTPRDFSHWKYLGNPLPPDGMSVYLPDLLRVVSGYQLGDVIRMAYTDANGNERSLDLTVKGYVEDVLFTSEVIYTGVYVPAETYRRLSQTLGDSAVIEHLILFNIDDIANTAKLESEVRDIMGLISSSFNMEASGLMFAGDTDMVEMARCMMASMMSAMMVVFAFIIVFVCLLVVRFRIVNTIEDDMIKIGSLKSAGYTSRQIRSSILIQFGLIAGLGSLLGIAASYLVLPFVSHVFAVQSGLRWEQGFDGVISSAALVLILSIVAVLALVAARHVKKITPVKALRGESTAGKYKRSRIKLDKWTGSLPLAHAMKSVFQNMKQTVMVLLVVIAVAFAGTFGIIMYYNSTVDTTAFAEVPGDEIANVVALMNPQADQSGAFRQIAGMESVRKVQYFDTVRVNVDGFDVPSNIVADCDMIHTRLVYQGRYPEKSGEISVAGLLLERMNKKLGDSVSVTAGEMTEEFVIVGVANGGSLGSPAAVILTADYKRFNPDFVPQELYIYLDKGTNAAEFVEMLERRFDKDVMRAALDFDKGYEEGMASYQGIVAALGLVMLVITLFVITLVLYFMIGSTVVRRKKDLGIQKAVGYTTGQLMKQISMGFAIPTILGVALGCILGAWGTNPLMSLVMREAGVMKSNFIVDPLWIAVFGAATVLFSYFTSLLITMRIRKISAYALVTE